MEIRQPANESELREALALLVARPGQPRREVDQQIRVLRRYVQERGLSLEHCLVARTGNRLSTTCLCVDSPGRTSAVYIPAAIAATADNTSLVALMLDAANRARHRHIQFLQAIIPADALHEEDIYRRAGFSMLAELIYMESDLEQPSLVGKSPPQLKWQTYGAETHALFARVIQQTYEGSLDCASLNGVRDIEDILATHRATGEFNPHLWFLGFSDSDAVGTILLSPVPDQTSYEVVYMGLRPAFRGRGYGSSLLQHAVRTARDEAAFSLTLAVDAENLPAQRLYARFGFHETSRRHAWIRILT